jgi:CRISPR/Cas system-associated exonuclease Cas4 (RecB family)
MKADLEGQASPLPAGFQFSQASLQDFVDCRRRFQLRYLQDVAWPALNSEPAMENERSLQQGARFHHLVHQSLLGVPVERLSKSIHDDDLERWWGNYLNFTASLVGEGGRCFPEITLTSPLGNYHLLAKYDLIVIKDAGNYAIIDWKTSRRRPRRAWLAERLQTRVYPYLLALAGEGLVSSPALSPEQVEMVYWFAEFPDQPERFTYDQTQSQADHAYLQNLLEELERRSSTGDFPLTNDEKRCALCVYRSLCGRGVRAGSLQAMEAGLEVGEDMEVALDFEQVAEIEF